MKRILISGKDSYVGTAVDAYLEQYPKYYQIETLDMKGNKWREASFSAVDVVFHVAGIAHSEVMKADEETKKLFDQVNTKLTIETAKKAKEAGVGQFIFMSSMIVFGDSAKIGKPKMIHKGTKPKPANFYGDSKLKAEIALEKLASADFKVVILRPPMIYGYGSKGNFPYLVKLIKKLPFFPKLNNKRSMLYIENLCKFLKLMIDNEERGIFHPQNEAYVSTAKMAREIAKVQGQRLVLTRVFNPFVWLLSKRLRIVNKVFGNFSYAKEMSEYREPYQVCDFVESIRRSVSVVSLVE